jgi:hypothetical protein
MIFPYTFVDSVSGECAVSGISNDVVILPITGINESIDASGSVSDFIEIFASGILASGNIISGGKSVDGVIQSGFGSVLDPISGEYISGSASLSGFVTGIFDSGDYYTFLSGTTRNVIISGEVVFVSVQVDSVDYRDGISGYEYLQEGIGVGVTINKSFYFTPYTGMSTGESIGSQISGVYFPDYDFYISGESVGSEITAEWFPDHDFYINEESCASNISAIYLSDNIQYNYESGLFSISGVMMNDATSFVSESGLFSISGVMMNDATSFVSESGLFSISGVALSSGSL